MITLDKAGRYKLIETKANTKVLFLDDDIYAWVEPARIGELLILSHRTHKTDCVLSIGAYRLYTVNDEPKISDHIHLELEVGEGNWQGYLLLSGLPNEKHQRVRIIPTTETITTND